MTGKLRSSSLAGGLLGGWLGGLLLATAAALTLGCVQPLKPYLFSAPHMARDPIEALAAAFTQNQLLPIIVDPQGNVVQSRWVDTGMGSKPQEGRQTTIVRRYSAQFTRGRTENEVVLTLEEQRCVVGEFTLSELEARGRCEVLVEVPESHKEDLHRLGRRMQQAMSIP